jgi:hypothetical protein
MPHDRILQNAQNRTRGEIAHAFKRLPREPKFLFVKIQRHLYRFEYFGAPV